MKQSLLLKLLVFTAMIGIIVPGFAQGTVKKLLVVDPSMSGYQQMANSLETSGVVLVLPITGNPFEHIKIKLGSDVFNEIHIYTHVKNGAVGFNALSINMDEMRKQAELLSSFKQLMTTSGTIYIHGDPGFEWINQLQEITSITVSIAD